MKYITGMYALNLPCSLDTCGDWHHSNYNWNDVPFAESDSSVFGEWGIEDVYVRERGETCHVANTIRVCLDLLEDGKFSAAEGMREDFICNESYTPIALKQLSFLIDSVPQERKEQIEKFALKEYKLQWLEYRKGTGSATVAAALS